MVVAAFIVVGKMMERNFQTNNKETYDRNGRKQKKKHKGGKNTSLSLEAFARAGKSTYDKRGFKKTKSGDGGKNKQVS